MGIGIDCDGGGRAIISEARNVALDRRFLLVGTAATCARSPVTWPPYTPNDDEIIIGWSGRTSWGITRIPAVIGQIEVRFLMGRAIDDDPHNKKHGYRKANQAYYKAISSHLIPIPPKGQLCRQAEKLHNDSPHNRIALPRTMTPL